MIIDITGIELTPGNNGIDCLGNGEHFYADGSPIECCCDECAYMKCCFDIKDFNECDSCNDSFCPHTLKKTNTNKQLNIKAL